MKTNQMAIEFSNEAARASGRKDTTRDELGIRTLCDLEMVLVGGGDGPEGGDAVPCW